MDEQQHPQDGRAHAQGVERHAAVYDEREVGYEAALPPMLLAAPDGADVPCVDNRSP